jgi:hypothetical protein
MNSELIDARPGTDGWSAPIDRESARALNAHFASHGGNIDRPTLANMLRIPSFDRELVEPLSDGYQPFWGAVYSVERGKMAVVFPFCIHGVVDRAVTVHIAGEIEPEDVDRRVALLTQAIPEMKPAVAVPIQDWLRPATPGPKKPVPVSDFGGLSPWKSTEAGSVI